HVHVWHHTETPIYVVGLDAFLVTFANHRAEAELIWQEDVHGLTGATVTAEAIIAAVYRPGQIAYRKGIFIERE
ncbi:FMN-binding protein, partial [Candidatus Acetothermia bacterium]|nr:FMN-binding protein [Candidatus Acetothermia bacterium]